MTPSTSTPLASTPLTSTPLVLTPLPAPIAETGAAEPIVAAEKGYPCRRCLRDAEAGDVVLLLSYDPWLADSPYRQSGPIYVHAHPCEYQPSPGLPEQLTSRLLSVRGFDAGHRMTGAEVVDGTELEQVSGRLFANEATSYLHVHNAAPGCFAVRIDRV